MKGLSKKHFSLLVAMLIALSAGFVYGAVNQAQGWHPLQQVATTGGGGTSVDNDNDGKIDNAEIADFATNSDMLDGFHKTDLDGLYQEDITADCGANTYVYGVQDNGALKCRVDQTGTIDEATVEGYIFDTDPATVQGIWTYSAIPAFNGGVTGSSAPFTVDSTYLVTNLNADLLDGIDSTGFQRDIGSNCASGQYVYGVSDAGVLSCSTPPGGTTPTLQQVTAQGATTAIDSTFSGGATIGSTNDNTKTLKIGDSSNYLYQSNGNLYVTVTDASSMHFLTNNLDRMWVASSGDTTIDRNLIVNQKIGIGTTSGPNTKLQVHSSNIRVSDATSTESYGVEYGINAGAMVIKGTYNSAVNPLLYQASYGSDDIGFVGDISVAGRATVGSGSSNGVFLGAQQVYSSGNDLHASANNIFLNPASGYSVLVDPPSGGDAALHLRAGSNDNTKLKLLASTSNNYYIDYASQASPGTLYIRTYPFGTPVMTFTSDKKVGINDANAPARTLDVNGDMEAANVYGTTDVYAGGAADGNKVCRKDGTNCRIKMGVGNTGYINANTESGDIDISSIGCTQTPAITLYTNSPVYPSRWDTDYYGSDWTGSAWIGYYIKDARPAAFKVYNDFQEAHDFRYVIVCY